MPCRDIPLKDFMNKLNYLIFLLLIFGAISIQTVNAQAVRDPALAALIEAEKLGDAFKAAQIKIAANPDDLDAYTALIFSVGPSQVNKDSSEAVLKLLEDCAGRLNAAVCHWGVGNIAGLIAIEGGMIKGLRMAPKIRSSFEKALQIDPLLWLARSGLVQYFLLAPSVAGGSVSKAMETASAESVRQPETTRLLKAAVHLHEEQWVNAEDQLTGLAALPTKSMRDDAFVTWIGLGFGWLKGKQTTRAKTVFERLQKERPASAFPVYGLGRVQTESGQLDEAINLLQRSASLKDAEQLPVDYRLGIAYQLKGDKIAAKSALNKALQGKMMSSSARKDAQKRIDEL